MAGLRPWLLSKDPSWPARSLRFFLRLLSLPYAIVVAWRNWAYDRGLIPTRSLHIPVICIGNLTVGGTGKTPMVAWLARWLRKHGLRTAIVSRGYGQLQSGQNDEALELELRLPDVPHIQNPDRFAAGLLAQDELGMDVVVLDDGFQHRRLARDLDIVLIDATDPPAAHWLLPGGLMREPWRALKRAGVVILTRTTLADENNLAHIERLIAKHAPAAVCLRSWHQATSLQSVGGTSLSLNDLRGKRVIAFCGVGNPQPFFQMLIASGLNIASQRTWPDHHAYSSQDVSDLNNWSARHADCAAIVCTMKDWVKLQIPRLGPLTLLALEIDVVIDPQQQSTLENKLVTALTRHPE